MTLLALMLAAAAVALLVDQVQTRRRPIAKRLYLPSPRLGWTLRPGLRRKIDLRRNGELIWEHDISINGQGFNDREWGDKSSSVRRVLVVGDSIVESRQLSRVDNFVAKAEAHLNRDGHTYELFNVGVAGWSVDSALNYFQQTGRGLHPDVVILGLFVGNDLAEGDYDTFRYLFAYGWDCRRYDKPAFTLVDGTLQRSNFPAWRNLSARLFSVELYERSRAFRRLYQRFNRIMEKRRNGSNLLRAKGVSYNAYLEQTKGNEFFYRQTLAQVSQLADACRAAGSRFGVMLEPNFPLFYPRSSGADARANQEYDRDLTHYAEMRRRLAEKYPVLSLIEPFHAQSQPITFRPADPHLNHAGHDVVALLLAELIRDVEAA